jgi:hypothetical protein
VACGFCLTQGRLRQVEALPDATDRRRQASVATERVSSGPHDVEFHVSAVLPSEARQQARAHERRLAAGRADLFSWIQVELQKGDLMTTKFDPLAYKSTTLAQWETAAPAWHGWGATLEAWIGAATDAMLDAAAVTEGCAVLDVAAGGVRHENLG